MQRDFIKCIGDDLYLFGGESSDGDQTTVLNDLYKYRTTKNEWFKVESLNTPSPRCSHQAISLNDHLYVFGGEYATLTQFYHYRDLWRLDAKTLAWEQVEPCTKTMPSSRSATAWSSGAARFWYLAASTRRRRTRMPCS